MKLKQAIPNILTAGNLFFGMSAIVIAQHEFYYIDYAFIAILLAAACDLLDGMVARLLKVPSEFGKQFDSLCDVVSFGVAPAMISIAVLQTVYPDLDPTVLSSWLVFLPPMIFAIAAGIRLAIFNLDTRQTKYFRGLPSPAAGLFLACTSLYWSEYFGVSNVILFHAIMSLVLAAFMLIPIPLVSLKLNSGRSMALALLLVLVAIPLFIIFQWASISLILLVYMVASPVSAFFARLFSDSGHTNTETK